ncbi:hypothetical protein CLU79DRAFT_205994 [Phycomyces nitens]|nr:hypothetical protein CLU79DRAFT_205994 [Phycomyces nitens]
MMSVGYLKRTIGTCQNKKAIVGLQHLDTGSSCTTLDSITDAAAFLYEYLYAPEPIDPFAPTELLTHLSPYLVLSPAHFHLLSLARALVSYLLPAALALMTCHIRSYASTRVDYFHLQPSWHKLTQQNLSILSCSAQVFRCHPNRQF